MDIDPGLAIMWGAAVALGVVAWRKDPVQLKKGALAALSLFRFIAIRLPLAILLAGFLSQVIPREMVAQMLGEQSGLSGLVIASLVGGLVPSGPFVSFPIALTLFKAGASLPALIAFITGWSVFAFHRVLIYEWPLMGAGFSLVRLAASLVLPPLAGVLAGLLYSVF
jgi:uncharacterized membrane protein YraQ (UPF0718 family)